MLHRLATACLVSVVALAMAFGMAQPAHAQPPPMPHGFWGSVTIDGNPASTGTTVSVRVGVTEVGSITTDAQGMYSCTVSGTSGAPVEFYVSGAKAQQAYTLSSGAITNLDLSVGEGSAPPSPPPTTPPAPPPPEETAVDEPAVDEPAIDETANNEPAAEQPATPVTPPTTGLPWPLFGGIIGVGLVLIIAIVALIRRRAY